MREAPSASRLARPDPLSPDRVGSTIPGKCEGDTLRIFMLPLFAIALALSACAGSDGPSGNAIADAPRVSVQDFEYKQLPGGARIITGSVYNPTQESIAHAQIQVSLYDASNTRVGSMIIPVHGIEPGEAEPFREAVKSELDVRAAKPRSVLVQ